MRASGGSLTLSGNEITDGVRAANVSGDGRSAPDSSFGVWSGATNLLPNGGFESGLGGLNNFGPVGIYQASGGKFGQHSVQVNVSGSGQGIVISTGGGSTFAPGSHYTGSVWLRGSQPVTVWLRMDASGFFSNGPSVQVSLSSTWQRVVVSGVIPSDGRTYSGIDIAIQQTSSATASFYADGAQLETGGVATPYIDTASGTAGTAMTVGYTESTDQAALYSLFVFVGNQYRAAVTQNHSLGVSIPFIGGSISIGIPHPDPRFDQQAVYNYSRRVETGFSKLAKAADVLSWLTSWLP